MNAVALAISFQGTTAMPRMAHKICPRRMVKYFGNRPVMSAPKGIEFAPKLVAKALRMKLKETKKTPARPAGVQ